MVELPLIARAISHGSRIAIRDESLDEFTYADLVQGSLDMARCLLPVDGNKHDDLEEMRVAFLIPSGHYYIQTQWGIWRAGGVAVPLSLSATEKELEYVLVDSQANIVVTISRLAEEKVHGLCQKLDVRIVLADKCPSTSVAVHGALPNVPVGRRAMILYTSGTTSQPKGVVTTHAQIEAQITALIEAWRWVETDSIPLFLPLHHIHGIINVQSCALWSGAKIEAFVRFDAERILTRVSEHVYTVFMAVPTIYVKLIESLEAMSDSQRQHVTAGFSKMRLMVSGSAALPATVHKRWTELTGQHLLERYGMTEIGMALSNPYSGERRPGAVGVPLPRVQVRLQAENGDIVSEQQQQEEETPGEIQVRGPNVFLEYWNRPDVVNDSFTVDGWFRTGDVAVLERGYYRILGRKSVDIIKSGGYKLSALEIEAVLLDHPSIAQCAVVGLDDTTWGEVVAVAVVVKSGTNLDLDGLKAWCGDRISKYKLPRKWMVVNELPRNAMGKVTKPAVKKLFEESAWI